MTPTSLLYKNIQLNYYDQGKGSALIFLHGFLENGKMWESYLQHFSAKYRVISLDLLGHGDTGCLGYVHSMEDMADAVHAVIAHLKLKKVTLIGHSMGGYVSLAFAELYPDNVKNLILINSTARADSAERVQNRNRAIDLIKKNAPMFITMAINNLFADHIRPLHEQEINHTREEALKTTTQGVIAALEGMKTRIDREVLLHFAPYSITLILGQEDPVMPYQDTVDQTLGTKAEVITLEGGHMLHIEQKEALKQHLIELVK
ncbi:alpha/beta hydrolase [Myroides sp. 1354]|uniref:alpha/beta fold hydrolase n=1 Tax=unclassified Myroides TaxID=2642485 RepID=UPI00257651C6|nr:MULTISPECIES: alpha/beta hydrolase [unclassified Myroides]MDM1045498.1 alpha/beta hydrolase [Myroides sp. R163-1]MDM1056500.1 alpha/beta hydrolase [Myroides sp. 1354]MDM1069630.1 alpha/beta hydrolase [Myroides sp. 1372]